TVRVGDLYSFKGLYRTPEILDLLDGYDLGLVPSLPVVTDVSDEYTGFTGAALACAHVLEVEPLRIIALYLDGLRISAVYIRDVKIGPTAGVVNVIQPSGELRRNGDAAGLVYPEIVESPRFFSLAPLGAYAGGGRKRN